MSDLFIPPNRPFRKSNIPNPATLAVRKILILKMTYKGCGRPLPRPIYSSE